METSKIAHNPLSNCHMPCLLQLTRRQCSNQWYYGNCEQMLIMELTETAMLGVWSMTLEHMLRSVTCMTN